MSAAPINPYDPVTDPDRHEIWELLVARDCDAFAARDWGLVAYDFAADRFDGIDARGSADPRDWSLTYPTVESYRDDWLRMAADYLRKPLTTIDHRGLLYRMTTLDWIEIAGDRALIWKAFDADEPLRDGGRLKVAGQSVYRLHQIGREWKIAGFVGYLPREARA